MHADYSPTLVDLFCGAGGLSLGFREAGFRPVFAADFDAHACATYRKNLGAHVHMVDLSTMPPERLAEAVHESAVEVDVVAGGPPCQGWSVQRRGAAADDRNDLTLKYAAMAAALRPKAIVMENVPTLLGARGREHMAGIEALWNDAGYLVHRRVMDAAAFGVPQTRRRAVVVALRRDAGLFSFPSARLAGDDYVTVRQALQGLPPPPEGHGDHPRFLNHRRVAVSARNLERLSYVPEGGGRLDVPEELKLPCHRQSNGHRHLDVFGRLWWDRPAGTITAMFDNFTRGRFAHPVENRNITAREGARLQSFPDSFEFSGPKKDVARQIGNAVPPLLARAVAEALLEAFANGGTGAQEPVQSLMAV